MKIAIFFPAVIFLLLIPMIAVGQESPPSEPKAASDEEQPLTVEPGVPAGEYIYRPEGRRDPFWNLLQGKNVRENRQSIEGIGGLLIDELDLEGIMQVRGKYRAMLKGPDSRGYIVTVGDKVYDGEVVVIDRNSISFKKSLTVALGGQKERVIVKALNPEEEEKKKDEKIDR
jgi:Tfp pilus assembly protein PilP